MRYLIFSLSLLSLAGAGLAGSEARSPRDAAFLNASDSTDADSSQIKKLPDVDPKEGYVPVDVIPEMIIEEQPEYPATASRAGLEGVVWVKALVGSDGNVHDAEVGRTSGTPSLDEAAIKAAFRCKFSPAIQRGRPVAVWVTYRVQFDRGLNKHRSRNEGTIAEAVAPIDWSLIDSPPRFLYFQRPAYSSRSRSKGEEGTVWIKVLVSRKGKPTTVELDQSSGHPHLDQSAVKAAAQNRFQPATTDGKPVDCWVKYKVEFKLEN